DVPAGAGTERVRFRGEIVLGRIGDGEEASDDRGVPGDALADDPAVARAVGIDHLDLAGGDPFRRVHVDQRAGGAELLRMERLLDSAYEIVRRVDELAGRRVPALDRAPEAVEVVLDLGGDPDRPLVAAGREDVALVDEEGGGDEAV